MMFFFLFFSLFCAAQGRAKVLPPDPPSQLSGFFAFQTQSNGHLLLPSVSLSWEAPIAKTYLIAGYRILRQTSTEKTPSPINPKDLVSDESYTDFSVSYSNAYTYWAVAVDAKGNTSTLSNPFDIDLSKLPEATLAPDAPANLTALPGREKISLQWSATLPKADPISYYLLFRSESDFNQGDSLQTATEVYDTQYKDTPPSQKRLYYYRLQAVDAKSRRSPYSLTVSAQVTGTILPGPPRKLTAVVGVEKLSLSWEASQPGTAPISEYRLRRRFADRPDSWVGYAPKAATVTSFVENNLTAGQAYEYELRAADLEGNTSEPSLVSAIPLKPHFDKSQLILMPTAYAAADETDLGWTFGVQFNYYIGSLYESYDDPQLGRTKSAFLQRIGFGSGSLNVKNSFWDESKWLPGLAAGVNLSALLDLGQPSTGASQSVGVSSSGNSSIRTLGGLYVVASKRFGEHSAIHLGYMQGGLADAVASAVKANPLGDLFPTAHPDWELTLRHLLPGGNFTEILGKVVDPDLSAPVDTAPDMLFAGLQMPFTLPLGFTRWHTGIKAEFMMPVFPDVPTPYLPWMLNVHFENLKLFGFEFSYFKFYNGYQIVGFYNLADWSW